MSARARGVSRLAFQRITRITETPSFIFNVINYPLRSRTSDARASPFPSRSSSSSPPSVQTDPWGISRVTDRSFVMKYTITKDAEAEIQYEGKEGNAGEKPRTVVEVRPSIRPFAVASRRANANATPTMKDDEDYRN